LPGLAVHRSFRSPQVCIDLFEFWPWRTPEWWKNTTATRLGELLGVGLCWGYNYDYNWL
jgi:hypothetical protein